VATNHNISQNQLQSNGNNPPTAVRHESKFTTTDCLNQGHNESTFPGLNVIALQIEELSDFNDEGETAWNAIRRAEIAKKMQRIAAGGYNSVENVIRTVAELEEVGQ
jgi:hypothetical protein